MLNGKTELRNCINTPKIDRSNYGRLSKVPLKGAISLELDAEGTLILTTSQGPTCVVPVNVRLEKNALLTPAEVAAHAALAGTVLSASANQANELPPLKPGVQMIFVAAPDTELAEFLRAQRARSTAVWLDFLSRYGSSSRAPDARNAVATLFEDSAESELTLRSEERRV